MPLAARDFDADITFPTGRDFFVNEVACPKVYFVYSEGRAAHSYGKRSPVDKMKKRHPIKTDGDIFREVLD